MSRSRSGTASLFAPLPLFKPQPSPQQSAFYEWVREGSGSCVLEAVAGSGKTTTLVEGLSYMKGSVFVGVFNKQNKKDLSDRVGTISNVDIKTFHGAGRDVLQCISGRSFGEPKPSKCLNIYEDMSKRGSLKDRSSSIEVENRHLKHAVVALVLFAKQNLLRVDDPNDEEWLNLIHHHGLARRVQNVDLIITLAKRVLDKSNDYFQEDNVIDFEDMLYLPLAKIPKFPEVAQYDWVLIDEAQDSNLARREMAKRLLASGGRMVAVGDPRQAIYGFAGATLDAIRTLGREIHATWLPLTVCHRCPKLIVNYAQTWVEEIEPRHDAKDGLMLDIDKEQLEQQVRPGDVILCRRNAPLVAIAHKLIRSGIPARMNGHNDIGKDLKAKTRELEPENFEIFRKRLKDSRERETLRLLDEGRPDLAKDYADKINSLDSIVVNLLRSNYRPKTTLKTIEAVCNEIDALFNPKDKKAAVLLSSIHRSKGGEWDRVFWLQERNEKAMDFLDWELIQEENLKYVAATRSKSELYFVHGAA